MASDRGQYYNRSTLWWKPNTRMYDALDIDHQIEVLKNLSLQNTIM
jgi:hypothetical protein